MISSKDLCLASGFWDGFASRRPTEVSVSVHLLFVCLLLICRSSLLCLSVYIFPFSLSVCIKNWDPFYLSIFIFVIEVSGGM